MLTPEPKAVYMDELDGDDAVVYISVLTPEPKAVYVGAQPTSYLLSRDFSAHP